MTNKCIFYNVSNMYHKKLNTYEYVNIVSTYVWEVKWEWTSQREQIHCYSKCRKGLWSEAVIVWSGEMTPQDGDSRLWSHGPANIFHVLFPSHHSASAQQRGSRFGGRKHDSNRWKMVKKNTFVSTCLVVVPEPAGAPNISTQMKQSWILSPEVQLFMMYDYTLI